MRCINRCLRFLCLVLICFSLAGCKKTEDVITPYETENYNKNLYIGNLYSEDICVSSENVSIDGFTGDSTLHASALFDLSESKVAYAENIHAKIYPASTTKILAALVTLENCNLDDVVTISKAASASSFAFDEQVCRLVEGDQITVRDLLNGLLIYSGNDTAVAIAEYVGGSIENFAAMMNKKAHEIHATNTHFVTPNGLHDENHYTTAYDLYLIFKECIKYEEFVNIVGSSSYTANIVCADGTTRQEYWDSTSFYAKGVVAAPTGATVIGGKTGYTGEAGNCLILLNVDANGNQYISIVMGASEKPVLYEDMTAIINQIPNI